MCAPMRCAGTRNVTRHALSQPVVPEERNECIDERSSSVRSKFGHKRNSSCFGNFWLLKWVKRCQILAEYWIFGPKHSRFHSNAVYQPKWKKSCFSRTLDRRRKGREKKATSHLQRRPRPKDGELVLQVADSRLQGVPLLQDVLQFGQTESRTLGILLGDNSIELKSHPKIGSKIVKTQIEKDPSVNCF